MCLCLFNSKVGSYHASSLFVATRPPTYGVVSRGIGVEGVCTVLAGLWGTGVGSATVTENVHTIAVTKMGSRRAVGFGAILLLLLSVVGKKFISNILFKKALMQRAKIIIVKHKRHSSCLSQLL